MRIKSKYAGDHYCLIEENITSSCPIFLLVPLSSSFQSLPIPVNVSSLAVTSLDCFHKKSMWVQNHKVEEKKSKLLGVKRHMIDLGNNSKTPVYEQYMNNV